MELLNQRARTIMLRCRFLESFTTLIMTAGHVHGGVRAFLIVHYILTAGQVLIKLAYKAAGQVSVVNSLTIRFRIAERKKKARA
eukprot:981733-Prorocentrum_minimum.AAC.1